MFPYPVCVLFMPFKKNHITLKIKLFVFCVFIYLDACRKNLIPDELARKFENRIAS